MSKAFKKKLQASAPSMFSCIHQPSFSSWRPKGQVEIWFCDIGEVWLEGVCMNVVYFIAFRGDGLGKNQDGIVDPVTLKATDQNKGVR